MNFQCLEEAGHHVVGCDCRHKLDQFAVGPECTNPMPDGLFDLDLPENTFETLATYTLHVEE